jgi:hypothetical protein
MNTLNAWMRPRVAEWATIAVMAMFAHCPRTLRLSQSIGHGDASANAGDARLKASVKAQSMGVDSAPEPESA